MKTIRTKRKKTAHRLCPPNGLRYFCSIMKKILLLSALIITATASRAESIDTLFHRTPERVLPLLDGNTRLDLLDLYNHKMEAKAENIFGGMAKLTRKTSDYAHVVLTNVSEWEMKLLTTANDTLICVVHTRRTPTARSTIRMFRKNWQPADTPLPAPVPADFVCTDSISGDDEQSDIMARLTNNGIEAHWDSDESLLTLHLSTAALTDEQQKKAEAFLQPLRYRWENGRFVMAETQRQP